MTSSVILYPDITGVILSFCIRENFCSIVGFFGQVSLFDSWIGLDWKVSWAGQVSWAQLVG